MSESVTEELIVALADFPEDIKWAVTNVHADHKKNLECMNISVPELGSRAVEKRKQEFYAGRWCAYQAIHSKTGAYLTPRINQDRSPCWPLGLVGSISHSSSDAIAVVAEAAEYHGLGIDIQEFIAPSEKADISSLILTLPESELSQGVSSGRGLEVFFSAKETLYKALYPQCLDLFDHKDVEIITVDLEKRVLEIRLLRSMKKNWFKGQSFTINYRVCSRFVLSWMFVEVNKR